LGTVQEIERQRLTHAYDVHVKIKALKAFFDVMATLKKLLDATCPSVT